MPSRVVLVTGVSRYLGSRLAGLLEGQDGVERVIGVDTVPPQPAEVAAMGGAEFVRADIRNPLIAKVIARAEVDTVVHLNLISAPSGAGGRAAMKETNVIGTMQLLAACQKAPSMRRVVVKSTTAVYGCSPRDPALFSEDMEPTSVPRSGYAKDAVEVEGYVRGFARRRPDVALSLLRFTNVVGPRIQTTLTRYFSLAVVPTVLGFDPRIQLCHEDDAVEVLRRMALEPHPGTYNVGGPGVLLLSQAIRRAGRPAVPVPAPAVSLVARALRRSGRVDVSLDQMRYLEHGRGVEVSRLRRALGWGPRPTVEAFDAYAASHRLLPAEAVEALETAALAVLRRRTTTGNGAPGA